MAGLRGWSRQPMGDEDEEDIDGNEQVVIIYYCVIIYIYTHMSICMYI